MKKAAAILLTALLFLFNPPVSARADETYVTYILLTRDTPLMSQSGDVVCILPATYFAVSEGDVSDGKYPVSYLDLRGYVSASDAQKVDYEPVTKFAVRTAKPNNDGMPVNVRSYPDQKNGEILCSVAHGSTLALYGSREGGELFAGAGNLWQYVKFESGGKTYYGYAYSPQLEFAPLEPNKIEKVPRPSSGASESDETFGFSATANIILAAALCVPAGIIMLVLFYRPESKRTPRHSRQR